jgi:ribokinase
MQGATILSPNESETKALTGIFPDNDENVLKAAKILEERSKAKYIVLKLGERGCALWDKTELTYFPAYKSNVVDTTAAGDCFTAALALHYISTSDIEDACRMGNRAGAYAVSKMGAQSSMPSQEDLINI